MTIVAGRRMLNGNQKVAQNVRRWPEARPAHHQVGWDMRSANACECGSEIVRLDQDGSKTADLETNATTADVTQRS
jgi:hypothetical protein